MYALCFPAASAAVRFSMALQVSLLYGTWDNDVLENSVRPHYSRSGQLLARGPTVACMVITLDENDGDDENDGEVDADASVAVVALGAPTRTTRGKIAVLLDASSDGAQSKRPELASGFTGERE